jgi:Flp pilus assembly protein TadB
MGDPLDILTAPMLLLMLIGGGIVVVLIRDTARHSGPRAKLEQRLEAVLHRFAETAPKTNQRIAKQHIFKSRPRGPIAAFKKRLHDVSVNVGGYYPLGILFGLSLVGCIGGATAASVILAVHPLLEAGVGLIAGVLVFHMARGELQRRWMVGFLDQLVEAVELLGRSVRSGYATPAAIRMVGKEIGEPVGPIFIQISDEDDLGIDLRVALRSAAERVGLPDFTFLIVALVMQRETGGQIAESLDNLHFVLRKRREARIKVMALTAEGRMSAMIVGAIPFFVSGMLYIMTPDQFNRMLEPGLGQTLLGTAAGFLTVGILVTRWMVNVRP